MGGDGSVAMWARDASFSPSVALRGMPSRRGVDPTISVSCLQEAMCQHFQEDESRGLAKYVSGLIGNITDKSARGVFKKPAYAPVDYFCPQRVVSVLMACVSRGT